MSQRVNPSGVCRLLGVLLLLGGNAAVMAASTFVLVNIDGPNEGFNDPTPVAPVIGNPGTTLGQQRQNVFIAAMQEWADTLDSDVEIRIDAQFDPLECTAFSAILGQAGATTIHRDFSGAIPGTWYGQALANSVVGSDVAPTRNDITATFNSALNGDATCLGGLSWDYRIPSSGSPLSLYSVVLHELGHGLNFQTFTNVGSGVFLLGFPDIYSRFLFDPELGLRWTDMTDAERASSATGENLFWIGANAKIAGIGVPLTAGSEPENQRPQMYAPNPLRTGSSVSHWDTGLTPDELMEPFSTANPWAGTTVGAFVDMGWSAEFYGCGVDYSIGTNWHQIGLPCVAANPSVRVVFGDDLNAAEYINRWAVYGWDTSAQSYFLLDIDDALSHGDAYWIRTLDGGSIDIEGTATPLATTGTCPDPLNGCFAVDIGTPDAFHMVAHALPYSVDWRDVRFASGGVARTPSEAQQANWAENVFYRYTGSNYDTFDDTVLPATLDSHDGIWVRTLAGAPTDLQLLFPAAGADLMLSSLFLAGAGIGTADSAQVALSAEGPAQNQRRAKTHPRAKSPPEAWSIHIAAAADGMTAANNLLGWHPDSLQSYDTRDLPELLPFSDPYLTLVFPHADWAGSTGGDYTTDFHRPQRNRHPDNWLFEVRSDDPTRTVTLTWEGPDAVLASSVLIDEANRMRIPATQRRYEFDLVGQTHSFRWHYKPRH